METRTLDLFSAPEREVRLGVTMVGGTSLAIYENGVAQELYRLARGRGVYGLIKQLTHSHVLLDVLSGTSAGGINNIFLATALAAGKDLSVTKKIWIAQGGIGDLMQDPLNPKVASILQGEGYYYNDALKRGFRQLFSTDSRQPTQPFERPLADIPSPGKDGPTGQDLDLFVTGTFHDGMPFTFYDARNQPIATRSYRGIFHLEHRPARHESHFAPLLREPTDAPSALPRPERIIERLTRIARTTSSLPAVFEPSRVEQDLMGGVIQLPRSVSYMLDGGNLNNRPINLSLEAIYRRAASREVVRKMLLVEPDPELRPSSGSVEDNSGKTRPDSLQNVLHFLRTPLYQSMIADLEQLEEHNRRVRQLNEVLARVKRETVRPEGTKRDGPSPQQQRIWLSVRLDSLTRQLIDLWEKRLGVRQDAADPISGAGGQVTRPQRERRAAALRAITPRLTQRLESSCQDTGARDPEPFRLIQIDTAFVQRKAYRAIYDLYAALYPSPSVTMVQDDAAVDESGPALQLREHLRRTLQSQPAYDPRRDTSALGQLSATMNDWFQVIRLLETITLNVATVCVQVAAPDPETGQWAQDSAAASEASAEQSARELWTSLRAALRDLLALPEFVDGASELLGELKAASRGEPFAAPQRIDEKELEAFEAYLRHRAEAVCTRLRGGGYGSPASVGQSDEAETPTLVTALSRLLDRQIAWTAQTLAPAYRGNEDWALIWAVMPSVEDPGPGGQSKTQAEVVADRADRVDAYLFPMEYTAGLRSRDEIELVRISPVDSQSEYSRENPEYKIAGDAALNLGAFFKRSWRANDILWGRLDAANALVDTLLEPARLAELLRHGSGDRERIHAALCDALGLRRDGTTAADQLRGDDKIGAFLAQRDSFAGEMARVEAFLTDPGSEAGLTALRALLLRRLQMEILMEEVPQALGETLSEQAEWSALRQDDGSLPAADASRAAAVAAPIEGAPADAPATDRTTREIWRSRAIFRVTADLGLDDPARVHELFTQGGYQIGEEKIGRNIPPLVLLRQSLGGLLILVHLLSSLMRGSDQGGQNPVARALSAWVLRPVGLVARLLYLFFTAMTQGATIALVVQSALWTVALGLGGVALWRLLAGAEPDAWLGNLVLSLFALLLIAVYSFLRRKRVRASVATALVTILIIALLSYLGYRAYRSLARRPRSEPIEVRRTNDAVIIRVPQAEVPGRPGR